ncbi:Pc12g08970 [Penicillium rubens Wisconsin 54-1255]|uniref:Pc12g08970 protein n=1 Tax=Penicillium rubens (strain ATCC 28089 / DSM 1075 / NRRL 1951 / Wisconsin 54-1255) TaxID=500485 RepID=B6GYW4_PENRW|nr:Pc12g08970 [Penicillium rubens Wisconsin 54-1255]
MRLSQVVFLSLFGFAAAAPAPDGLDSSAAVVADDFKPDWDAFESDFKLALEESEADASLAKRLNTQSASNVAYGKAIYAAGSAAVNQIKGLKNWNKAREQFTQLGKERGNLWKSSANNSFPVTQGMMDHNPDPKTAVAAICYNKGYGIQNPEGIYGLHSEKISVWPASTDYDCFYMGKNNAFWSYGDGGTINLFTRWQHGACRFDDKSDLYC